MSMQTASEPVKDTLPREERRLGSTGPSSASGPPPIAGIGLDSRTDCTGGRPGMPFSRVQPGIGSHFPKESPSIPHRTGSTSP